MNRHDLAKLPERIVRRVNGLPYTMDTMGMSGSTILLFDKMVLKIEKVSRSSVNEHRLLEWLGGRLPVPEIIEHETREGISFLLMTRLPGEMACSESRLRGMGDTVSALAAALKMLWSIDISGSPCSNVVAEKLEQARYRIENGLVSTDEFEPETFGEEGFRSIPDLYDYLDNHRPREDLVFSHGDFCLPNILVSGRKVTGFLDWGNGGIADRWQDIALCVRSLRRNQIDFAGYSQADYEKGKAQLFAELGIKPDEEKIRYYVLLDELF